MHKMPKKMAQTFTNTFDGKCAIMVSVGASKEFSMPFYYTYIYKKKRLFPRNSRFFCVKNFLEEKDFFGSNKRTVLLYFCVTCILSNKETRICVLPIRIVEQDNQ